MSNRRRDEEQEKLRAIVLLLGLACIIQLFVSLQASRSTLSQMERRDEEARKFDRLIRSQGAACPRSPE